MLSPPPTLHRRRRAPEARGGPAASAENVVPYDYGATFDLKGQPGAIRQDVINVSPDGIFVAVAIGYGFEEDRGRGALLSVLPRVPAGGAGPVVPTLIQPGDLTLGELPPTALIEGFRIHPKLESLVFATRENGVDGNGNLAARDRELSDELVPVELLEDDNNGRRHTLFQQVRSPAEISFLFSLLDSSSGRELQDEPTHNLASLGKSNGERPFRWLAQPVTFMPRSTVRLQVIERTEGVRGTLFIVFYGYKVLGSTRCAEPIAREIAAQTAARGGAQGEPSERVIPFDYVTTFALTGRPGNQVEAEATVNVEGGFIATSIGYGLQVEEVGVAIQWQNADAVDNPPANASTVVATTAANRIRWLEALRQARAGTLPAGQTVPPEPTLDLAALPLRLLPASALADGIRLRPELVRVGFENNGRLAASLPVSWLDRLFERLNRAEDVSFRYTIYDGGRGRELQNQELNNLAGLGIANGERPFKKFARPLAFLPRSTIRVRIEERFGRGTLFIVFHGYKVLNAGGGSR
jgi:hypothetical protein